MSKMPHIQLDGEIGAVSAILPGDPARVDAVAAFLTDVHEETFNREYKSITGTYRGERILVISTGMGGPSAAICIEELANIGIRRVIRIGSCGALQKHLALGDLVICDRAVCDDGTSQTYLDYFRYASADCPAGNQGIVQKRSPEQGADLSAEQMMHTPAGGTAPDGICFAHADGQLQRFCTEAAETLRVPHAVGATRCHDALYLKQKPELDAFYSKKGILATDMETAAVFAVSALRGVAAASLLNVVVEWKPDRDIAAGISSYKDGAEATANGERNEILTALEALYLAAKQEKTQ